ncbi:MAG TPA: hypothetical protein PLC22_04625, partial [Gordonia sp. (in: high G+C Gram-positive bacteria)]|nr:hypothetical protein [Gordonia sp. (in: high G+C Gram-positive bacteria)]
MSSASEHPLIPATIADIAVWGPTAEQVDLHVERPDVVQVVSLVRDDGGWWSVPAEAAGDLDV